MIRKLYALSCEFGFNPLRLKGMKNMWRYRKEISEYNRLNKRDSFSISFKDSYPILFDYDDQAGSVRTHYFHQDLWAARKVFDTKPKQHIDIGSRIDGFIAHLLPFMDVTMVDVRPLNDEVKGLHFVQDDATKLEKFTDGSVESLSTLHAAEHFGLGRYGDPIDPDACFKFMSALERVLAKDGQLIFSVPVGRERVEFNAQRVFSPQTIVDSFSGLSLKSFSYVDDEGLFHEDADIQEAENLNFGCGLFEFTKTSS